MVEKQPAAYIWEAVSKGSVAEAESLLERHPDQVNARIPYNGGTFLHLAASKAGADMIRALVGLGFDIDKPGANDGEAALQAACASGNYATAQCLLDLGAKMDVATSSTNPLFGAIVGRSTNIAQLLLDRGIDSTTRYTNDAMTEMDAIAFALESGERDIAILIAGWNANGDETCAKELIAQGERIARLNNMESDTRPN